jgi:hypothetical protein
MESKPNCFHAGFLLGLFFDHENDCNMLLRNVGGLSTDYKALYPRIQNFSKIFLSVTIVSKRTLGPTKANEIQEAIPRVLCNRDEANHSLPCTNLSEGVYLHGTFKVKNK